MSFNPTNPDKVKRAEIIVSLVLGTKEVKNDEEATLKARHSELLGEKDINLKDEEAVLESVYLALGGGVAADKTDGVTEEVVAPKAKKAKKTK